MKLLRNLVIVALILILVYIALEIIIPAVFWVLKVIVTLVLLIAIGVAVFYLYRKLRA